MRKPAPSSSSSSMPSSVSSVTASSATASNASLSDDESAPPPACTCKASCPRHRISVNDFVVHMPALTAPIEPAGPAPVPPVAHNAEEIERLWEAIQTLTVNAAPHDPDDHSPMRQSGFLRDGEFGEDEMPDLTSLSLPVWVVWKGWDGRQTVHGVYPDWGRAGQATQGVSQARQMRYDRAALLWEDWRDAHLRNHGRRAFDQGSTLWSGSLLGPVVTRSELVARIRAHAVADGLDPDNHSTITSVVSSVLLPAVTQTPATAPPAPPTHNEYFYVVIRGTEPGLWYSREDYKEALGHHRKRWGYVAPTQESAEEFLHANAAKITRL